MFSSNIAGGNLISSSSVTFRKNKIKLDSAADSRDSIQTTNMLSRDQRIFGPLCFHKISGARNVPTISFLIPFLSILFSPPSLTLFNLFRSTTLNYAIHTRTHAQNIIFNNDALRRPSYWL